jgi:hypothetical protein
VNDNAVDELLKALADRRPLVLFLGQDIWSSPGRPDPTLSHLLNRIGRTEHYTSGWSAALKGDGLSAGDMEWITERFQRNVQPEGMQELLSIAWSAVFTTSIDPTLVRRIETHGRQPESILAKEHFARVPRSHSRPPFYYLFGRSNETLSDFKSPCTRNELHQRTATHANNMLNRIAETVTPLGFLIVEGYSSGRDWLAIDDFLAPLSTAVGLQILWFGATTPVQSEFFTDLVKKGTIVPCEKRLIDVVTELRARGTLESSTSILPDGPGVISINDNKFVNVSPSLRLRVEASAAIIDDTWTDELPPLDDLAATEAFRRFHGDLDGLRNLVEGIDRGFAVKRDFENKLWSEVNTILRDQTDRFLVLHGQSGTGKTVAIARLAYELRKIRRLPVLCSYGRTPQATDIEAFCREAELAGAPHTVILCDANLPLEHYRDLSNALKSKGRRVLVVGTCYRMESLRPGVTITPVEANIDVSPGEANALKSLVTKFGGDILLLQGTALQSGYALALIYRILSASRERIISGVSAEARAAETQLRVRARKVQVSKLRSALAEQLIAAGFHNGTVSLFDPDQEGAEFGTDAPGRLIDYVMVVGRLNCLIPVNLLIRVLRGEGGFLDISQIGELFSELDLFRWRMADSEGSDFLIAPRLQLEAELICRRRLSNIDREIDYLVELIEGVRANDVDKSAEIHFLLDLLQKLDKNGPRKDTYARGYGRIAESLTTLRIRHKVQDASLMLQESAFRRAAISWHDRFTSQQSDLLPDDVRYSLLDKAREVVEFAIREISKGNLRAGRKTKESLHVERASIYGYLAVASAKSGAPQDAIWSAYLAARVAVGHAMAISGNYYPLDVGLWTPVDILGSNALSPEQIAEMRADIYSTLDQVEPDMLPPSQLHQFEQRRLRVSDVLGDQSMKEEAYSHLESISPAVAYFLRARSMCSGIFGEADGPFDRTTQEKAEAAARFLTERKSAIASDTRCLHLLLQVQWVAATGHRLLHGDRKAIPFDVKRRIEIYNTVCDLNSAAGDGARFPFRFLEATLAWMEGETERARAMWATLSRDTEYEDPSRVIRRLYIADESGQPKKLRGRLLKQRNDAHWLISVEDVQGDVDLLSRDFKNEDLQLGREIRDFAIAFNYLGPIADPMSRYGEKS